MMLWEKLSAFIGLSFETVNKVGEFFETEDSPAIFCVKLSYRKLLCYNKYYIHRQMIIFRV